MKNNIIKIFGVVGSRLIYVIIGLSFSVLVIAAKATVTITATPATSGGTLSTAKWDAVVNDLNHINANIGTIEASVGSSGYKLLASSSSIDEESRIRLYPDGSHTIYAVGPRTVEVLSSGWDSSRTIHEIVFVTRNDADNYCAGGNGSLNLLAGHDTESLCMSCNQNGGTRSCSGLTNNDDWIALDINGIRQTGCPQDHTGVGNALFGNGGIGTRCVYQVNSTISVMNIDQADWSPGNGYWEWEVWYQ